MRTWWHSFLIALQFLTRIPVVKQIECTETELGHSVLFYPVVGLFLGVLLLVFYAVIPSHDSGLLAALLLVLWVLATGALHLDGLADSADALMGITHERERGLYGMAAVVTVTLVLIIKFASLNIILATIPGWTALLAIPILARTAIVLLFVTTPYTQGNGNGAVFAQHLPHQPAMIASAIAAVLGLLLLGVSGFAVITLIAGAGYLLRRLMMAKMGGASAGSSGAMIELTETVALVAMALVVG